MAQYDEYDEESMSGSELIKHLRKQIKELSSALDERDGELDELYDVVRVNDIATALEESGVNPALAEYVPEDVEDMDDLYDWLDSNADVFGIEAIEDDGELYDDEEYAEGEFDVEYDPELVQAAEQMAQLTDGGIDPSVGASVEDMINSATSTDELQAILRGA
jgi:hypothetical protein